MKAKNRKELREHIAADMYRSTGVMRGFWSALYYALRHPYSGPAFMFWFRIAQYGGIGSFFAKRRYLRISRVRNIDIPLDTDIGYGLYLGHFMCMVISPLTRIGNNCNLSQFLNIGTNEGRGAVIGDNVYIGPQVCIVEDVRIGSNVTIGAGAVVTKDIPDNATAAGVPAKVLNCSNPGRYIGHRWAADA